MIEVTDFLDRLPNGWRPRSFPQKMALQCPAEFLLLGGAAGSLKSSTVLMDAIKYRDTPNYRGIIFRKTYPEIEFLIDRTRIMYANTGAVFYEASRQWRWPWGALVEFRHLDKDKDVYKHQGPEYQFAAWDESTHFKEFQIRYIVSSRMRSVEGIPVRARCATNPGNVGHKFHKDIFIGPKCLHCIEEAAKLAGTEPKWLPGTRLAGSIYTDARWSDGVPINMSTCFIPGHVQDHDLFGAGGGDYANKKLRGLPKKLQEALLKGCWEAFEGQYFDIFDVNRHVASNAEIQDLVQPWWPLWVSIDYGFSHATVAYLHTMDSKGHVYTIAEYFIHHRNCVEVARDLNMMWNAQRSPKPWYLSPDAFDHDGTSDFSRAELMSQDTGLYFDHAYNDRISGAMLMYTMLSEFRWTISDACPLLISAMSTRIHDEKRTEDVLKVETDDEDDAYDAARYGLASHIHPGKKSEEQELKEKQEKDWSSDPTVAMLQYQKFKAERAKAAKPQIYKQRARSR